MLYVGNRNTHVDKNTNDQKPWLYSNEFPWLQSRGWTNLHCHSGSGRGFKKKPLHMASQYGCQGKGHFYCISHFVKINVFAKSNVCNIHVLQKKF